MPDKLYLGFLETSAAYTEAHTRLREHVTRHGISDIGFELGPPDNGRLPCRIILCGCKKTLCELSDIYPPFDDIRCWMERILRFDHIGRHHEEVLTLDCRDAVYSVHLMHAGWEDASSKGYRDRRNLSVFIVVRSGADEPLLSELCRTYRLIGNLYCAVLDCFATYRERFDNNQDWFFIADSPFERRPTAEVLYESFRSPVIENSIHFHPKRKR